RNAGYDVTTSSGSACPAVFGAGKMDCTPYLSPNPSDPWSGSIERQPLNLDAESTTQAVYLFDTIELSEAFQVNAGLRYDRYRLSGEQSGRSGTVEGDNRWGMFNY